MAGRKSHVATLARVGLGPHAPASTRTLTGGRGNLRCSVFAAERRETLISIEEGGGAVSVSGAVPVSEVTRSQSRTQSPRLPTLTRRRGSIMRRTMFGLLSLLAVVLAAVP